MTLVPEKLVRFRIAVPAEHEAELLAALQAVAKVHLEEPLREDAVLPELLVDILEGRVSPTTLDMEKALSTARKVLKEDDPLLLKLEKIFDEYEKLQMLRALAEQLEALGVSPSNLHKELYGTIADVIFVTEGYVGSATVELLRTGCAVKKLKLSPGEYALLLTYPTSAVEKVESVKKKYRTSLGLPEWFYDSFENIKNRLEEEELRVRREALGTLLDIASILRDALEFERTVREEVLEKAHQAVENLRKELPGLETALLKFISLHLVAYAYERGAGSLEELGLDKKLTTAVDSVLNERNLDEELVRKVVKEGDAGDALSSELLQSVQIYNSLLAAKRMVFEVEQSLSEDKAYCILCGVSDLAEDLKMYLQRAADVKVRFEKEYQRYYAALLEGELEDLERIARDSRRRHTAVAFLHRPGEGAASLKEQVTDSLDSRKTEILASAVYTRISGDKSGLSEMLRRLGRHEVLELWQTYTSLGAATEQHPSWYSQLRLLIASAEEAIKSIKRANIELSLLSSIPLRELPEMLGRDTSHLKEVLRKVHFVLQYAPLIETALRARSLLRELRVMRERRVTVVEGYIPAKEKQKLEEAIHRMVPRIIYFKSAEVPRSEPAPTFIEARGLRKHLYLLTSLRGVPSYWEIDPTPFFTLLFVTMYGMMFGDVGQGLVIALFGAWLLKTRFRLLGISEEGAASLGALALLAGISGVIFGALYGFVVFLKPLAHPVISPIHDVYEMIAVALWFGAAQLLLALALNVVNLVRAGDVPGAVFSGMGGMGILFYSSGIVIAYHLATSGFDLGVLSAPQLQPFMYLLLLSLLTVVGYGVYEWKIKGESEKIMHAISEVIEMLLALPANSLSYIRLAAFAMAHEAFSILAENMSPIAGELASYLLANFLVLAIEALAVGIQAMRLLYYEFSTKFFKGEGVEFKPLFVR